MFYSHFSMVVNVPCIKELYLKVHLVEFHGLTQLGMTCSLFLDEQMKFQVPTADFLKNFWEEAGRKKRGLVFTPCVSKLQETLHLQMMHEVSKTDYVRT